MTLLISLIVCILSSYIRKCCSGVLCYVIRPLREPTSRLCLWVIQTILSNLSFLRGQDESPPLSEKHSQHVNFILSQTQGSSHSLSVSSPPSGGPLPSDKYTQRAASRGNSGVHCLASCGVFCLSSRLCVFLSVFALFNKRHFLKNVLLFHPIGSSSSISAACNATSLNTSLLLSLWETIRSPVSSRVGIKVITHLYKLYDTPPPLTPPSSVFIHLQHVWLLPLKSLPPLLPLHLLSVHPLFKCQSSPGGPCS